MDDSITVDMLRQYLISCEKINVKPTLLGLWSWTREHNY